jgi:hypothetical protein
VQPVSFVEIPDSLKTSIPGTNMHVNAFAIYLDQSIDGTTAFVEFVVTKQPFTKRYFRFDKQTMGMTEITGPIDGYVRYDTAEIDWTKELLDGYVLRPSDKERGSFNDRELLVESSDGRTFSFDQAAIEFTTARIAVVSPNKSHVAVFGSLKRTPAFADRRLHIFRLVYDGETVVADTAVHEGPSTCEPVLIRLAEKTRVRVLDNNAQVIDNGVDDYWYEVETSDGAKGWVHASAVSIK